MGVILFSGRRNLYYLIFPARALRRPTIFVNNAVIVRAAPKPTEPFCGVEVSRCFI